jgi:hypothetical protein
MGHIFIGQFHDISNIGTLFLTSNFQVTVFPNVSAAMFLADATAIKVSLQETSLEVSFLPG